MAKKTRPLTILVTDANYEALEKLAEKRNISMAQVVREAIQAAAQHIYGGIPCCADGRACMVPQMHVRTPPTS